MDKISPQKAAKKAGVSRRTIMVAINNNKLQAFRDNQNNWQVEPDDLEKWISERGTRHGTTIDTSYDSSSGTTPSQVEVARLEEQLRAAHERLAYEREAHERREQDLQERLAQRDRDYEEAMALVRDRNQAPSLGAKLAMLLSGKGKPK